MPTDAVLVEAKSPARINQLHEIADYRNLLLELTRKELRLKYRRSNLGILWSLLNPLLMMLVYTLVFSVIARFPIRHYPMLVLPGLLAWNFMGSALTQSANVVVFNQNLVKKVYFPHEVLPLATVGANLINFLLSLLVLIPFLIYFRPPLMASLVLLPLLFLFETAFIAGLALLVSSLNVFFRDIEYLLGILLLMWFFVTPVIYPYSSAVIPHLVRSLLVVNPMTWLLDSYQQILYWGDWPRAAFVLGYGALSLLLLWGGALLFASLKVHFAEEV